MPIVAMQRAVAISKSKLADSNEGALPETCAIVLQSLLKDIPREEKAFKRIFDEYSTPVSYKQKFLDQNAFLVYYTKGFDGPGRPSIEEDVNSVQTLQYGARNDAWAAMDELFVELEFGKSGDSTSASKEELVALIAKILTPLDAYLSLAPDADVKQALNRVEKR
ncbi:hypothetical protein ACHAXT_000406 [Thalassiosira profunda]